MTNAIKSDESDQVELDSQDANAGIVEVADESDFPKSKKRRYEQSARQYEREASHTNRLDMNVQSDTLAGQAIPPAVSSSQVWGGPLDIQSLCETQVGDGVSETAETGIQQQDTLYPPILHLPLGRSKPSQCPCLV